MKPATTVRQELEDYLRQRGSTLHQFSEISGINVGTISSMLSGYRQISMHNLDLITEGMGQEEGSLYEVYLEGCLLNLPLDWRRLGPFLRRCAELGKLDCIERLVQAVADNLAYVSMLFETAEQFFREGKREAAALLYDCVAECERYQHSERLALSRYRLFTIGLGDDQEENMRMAVQFEPYVERLEEVDQLEAQKELADVYASLHQWDRVNGLAGRLEQKATLALRSKRLRKIKPKDREGKKTSRPPLFYLLYAYLLKANVCEARQEYDRALEYVRRYANYEVCSGEELSERERQVVEQFRDWGQANTYLYRLMSGEVEVLADYTECVAAKEHESIPAMYRILQAANRCQLNVDDLLERFRPHFELKERLYRFGKYNSQIVADHYVRFLTELAFYELHRQQHDLGIRNLLQSLELAIRFNHESMLFRCVQLFEQFRHVASQESQDQYKNLICEVKRIEKKSVAVYYA